jgi:methylated-DNA-[protein]-cysteine S-methyltransferase
MSTDVSTRASYCVFETAIGLCGVAWSERGLTCVQLPEADPAATARRLATRSAGVPAGTPPAPVADGIGAIVRYARGERIDFSAIALDFTGIDEFRLGVYAATRAIGWGSTASYGDIARRIDTPDAREVGQALSKNPIPLIIPCHRILASDGTLRGFSAYGGLLTKERLLALEGVGADAPRLPGL